MILPQGWAEATLGQVVTLNYGGSLPGQKRRDGDVPVYGSNGVVGYHDSPLILGPAIIVGRKGSAGKVHFSAGACFPIDTTYYVDDFSVLEPSYAVSLLKSLGLDQMDRATAVPGLNREDAYALATQIPPLAEQRRIVAKLNALTARLARARGELDRVPVLAANLRATALAATYERLSTDAGLSPVKDLIASLDQGWSPKCENFPSETEDQWAVLKTTAIQALEFRPGENKALPAGLKPRPRIEVAEGDILVTRAGPRVRCGITCIVGPTRQRLMLADKMYRLRSKVERARPDYLAMMLNTPQALAMIEEMKTGISDSGLNLTQEKFLSLPIPAVGLEVQTSAVAELSAAFARAARLEAEAARARALLDRLESALLAKAFRGELVPQDPNDEPAQALLDRIRTQRAAAPKAKRGRKAKVAT